MFRNNQQDEDMHNAMDHENLSDDDNAAPDMQEEAELEAEREDPLLLAIEDLQGRVVSSLDDFKMHTGVRSSSAPGSPTVHEELGTLLRPVMEVAAHTAPSVARTYYRGMGPEGVEASCEDVYQRVVSDLVLPVVLEIAQSDTSAARRAASLEFFRGLWKEYHKAGSWLDATTKDPSREGPYGSGSAGGHAGNIAQQNPAIRAQSKRRLAKRLAREGEILRYWVQASIACMLPGVFTDETAEETTASRGVIAASASIRPALKHIATRIRDTDDRGANRIFAPVMEMVEGVLKKLFLNTGSGDGLRSACIKFLEIVCFCCSTKPQDALQRRRGTTSDDFCLDDLPAGHPIITREALESVAEYAFSALRGLTLLGGQRKIDVNLLSDMMMTGGDPTAQALSILKPAALASLEIESGFDDSNAASLTEHLLDRNGLEFDFTLSQKSYVLTINAVAALSLNRPVFFKEGVTCLARRTVDPPKFVEGSGGVSKVEAIAIQNQLRASCLMLLRNALSVTTNSSDILRVALKHCGMELQANKALSMAEKATALKTAGRSARMRANMFYEWDTSEADKRVNKRQREMDDDLQKYRASKAARGLGSGIQMPTSMADAIDLVMLNVSHLPAKRPRVVASKRKTTISLDMLVHAVMTNGASLTQDEGSWYAQDGGSAWSTSVESNDGQHQYHCKFLVDKGMHKKAVDSETVEESNFSKQCSKATSEAIGRVVLNASSSRHKNLAEFANRIASRLSWSIKNLPALSNIEPSSQISKQVAAFTDKISPANGGKSVSDFSDDYPFLSAYLSAPTTSAAMKPDQGTDTSEVYSLGSCLLSEAYVLSLSDEKEAGSTYDKCLELFMGSYAHASEQANEKPTDEAQKKHAARVTSELPRETSTAPRLTASALKVICALCNIESIVKKSTEAARKTSQQSVATTAALNAARQAAEKRATVALLLLRDVAFQRNSTETRKAAVACAISIATGDVKTSAACEDKAMKLVMNVIFPRSDALAECVIEAATLQLQKACDFAIQNKTALEQGSKRGSSDLSSIQATAESEEKKNAIEKIRKPSLLFMALCVRRVDTIRTLFRISSTEGADLLSQAVQQNMPKLARAAGAKHGASEIALKVADMADASEISLLLAFLENLHTSMDKGLPTEDFVSACVQIQEAKAIDGVKDARYLIPVLSGIKREELVLKLPEFLRSDDAIFLTSLEKMSARLGRHALIFRDEAEDETTALRGMTLCEQLVFLHRLDFSEAQIPQRRYLEVIGLCLDHEELFNDRVIMSALDHISGTFLSGEQQLPLAYMRTIILVRSKHESLHGWICNTLLPRLIEGEIYTDRRQWEGWMRCAKMLEATGDTGVSSMNAIKMLPAEQLEQYQSRYG